MEPLEILMAADATYARQLAVAVTSLAATADRPCRVWVLHDRSAGIDLARALDPVRADLSIETVAVDAAMTAYAPLFSPRSMLYRLLLGEVLPAELTRVLYLDVDIVVRRPLTELWESDTGDAVIGAVRDAYRPWVVRDPRLPWRERGVPPNAPFFNSGMMLVSLPRWRAREIGPQALAVTESIPVMDQCALNTVIAGDFAALHPRWNVQSYHLTGDECLAYGAEGRDRVDEALADPAIVHFTGGTFNRPWEAPCGNPYAREWIEWLDRTEWRGWRPRPVPPTTRAVRRAQRAWRVLRRGGRGLD